MPKWTLTLLSLTSMVTQLAADVPLPTIPNMTISPSKPDDSASASRDLYPGESVTLQVTVEEDQEFKLEGNPSPTLTDPTQIWTARDPEGRVYRFDALHTGREAGQGRVELKATWRRVAPTGGGGSAETKQGTAAGTASTKLPVFTWEFGSRVQFADGKGKIHFELSAAESGATVPNLGSYVVTGEQGWIVEPVVMGSKITGSVRSATPGAGSLTVNFNQHAMEPASPEIAFAKVDLEIADYAGSNNTLKEDRPVGETDGTVDPPHEMDPGGIIVAAVGADTSVRAKLTVSRDSGEPQAGTFELKAEGLDGVTFYDAATGGNVVNIGNIDASKDIYIAAPKFTAGAGALDGTFTLTYSRRFEGATADEKLEDKVRVRLLPVALTAHKRGTIDAPGAAIPRLGGSEVYEVVTLENADYDETNWQPANMVDGAQEDKQDGKTDAVSKDKDDDFVKLRLSYPLTNVAGSSEIVFDQAGQGERMQEGDIRFHNSNGERVQLAALKIADLKNLSGPLAPAFAGGLDLFVEIGDLGKTTTAQGSADNTTRKYADLIWKITIGDTTIEQKVRIYRGGFWRNDRTNNSGTIALYDGKGLKADGTIDYGQIVKGPYQIKTGQEGHTDETEEDKGPTPMGWYGLWDRNPDDGNAGMRTTWLGLNRPQTNHHRNSAGNLLGFVQQGSYCQWAQAGNHNIEGKGAYGYDNDNDSDPYQGMPASIHFKFELSPIGSFTTRTFLQIHPDGFCDGTAGCVGIQAYGDCTKVLYLVRHYFQTRFLVD